MERVKHYTKLRRGQQFVISPFTPKKSIMGSKNAEKRVKNSKKVYFHCKGKYPITNFSRVLYKTPRGQRFLISPFSSKKIAFEVLQYWKEKPQIARNSEKRQYFTVRTNTHCKCSKKRVKSTPKILERATCSTKLLKVSDSRYHNLFSKTKSN